MFAASFFLGPTGFLGVHQKDGETLKDPITGMGIFEHVLTPHGNP